MSNKTKTIETPAKQLTDLAQNIGVVLMTAAVTFGMLEMPDHGNNKVVVPNQPAFAPASQSGGGDEGNNPIRREREETAPHYISYSVSQRTPSRSGKH